MKQKQKFSRIAFDQWYGMAVDKQTNEIMEWEMALSLRDSHLRSIIVWDWEILKLFLIVNNIVPNWIDCKGVDALYSKENGTWSGFVGKVCIL